MPRLEITSGYALVRAAAAAAALWENRIHLYQFSLQFTPRPRLPVCSAEQSVLSKTGQKYNFNNIDFSLVYE